ncbi:hypothetical protein DEO72_LG7g1879 [Vigna unguiculata]|uniref:Uncharacterized protein n=1 Tax=Vigna unguiculata TaxID=3917 RepID=A0A4D6MK53_VIGUN|nr:hypothetical protein DEO72_LG7g1879 [Vigna unguiculata]
MVDGGRSVDVEHYCCCALQVQKVEDGGVAVKMRSATVGAGGAAIAGFTEAVGTRVAENGCMKVGELQ